MGGINGLTVIAWVTLAKQNPLETFNEHNAFATGEIVMEGPVPIFVVPLNQEYDE